MSQAETLLDSLVDESTKYTPGMGANEEHIVIGKDRSVIIPKSLRKIAVQFDHNVETVTFDCPRYWDKLDMSKMKIYINYMRTDGYMDKYLCTNVRVDDEDDSIIHFDWTLTSNATQVEGNLVFIVCIKNVDADGIEENHWNSELGDGLYISEGMECEESVLAKYPDIITHLLTRMEEVEGAKVVVTGNQIIAFRNQLESEIAVERKRIDNLAKLGEGSTTGDVELIDGRTDYTGRTWDNIGAHVRGVTSEIANNIDNVIFSSEALFSDYDSISGFNHACGFNIYDIISRENPVSKRCAVNTIKVNTQTGAGNGYFKLCSFSIMDDSIVDVIEDDTLYRVETGTNEIKTTTPFVVDAGKYIGLMQVSTNDPFLAVMAVYPSTNSSCGVIARKMDGTIVKIDDYIPALEFEVCGIETWCVERLKSVEERWLYGKTWVAYGDSITAGHLLDGYNADESDNDTVRTYAKIIAEKYGMTYKNKGTSGRGYSVGQPYALYQTMDTAIENADIVTIAMGTNDFGVLNSENVVTFGDFTDTESTVDENGRLTFCACVKKTYNLVMQSYPNSVVIVMLPIPRPTMDTPNYVGKILQDYSDMIAKIAKQYGFYVMDCPSLARSNVKSESWREKYMFDNVHMTQSYHEEYYSPMVEKELKKAVLNN